MEAQKTKNQLFEIDGETLVKCSKDARGSITIPNGIKSIKYGAFDNCDNITSIEIPESLTDIDNLFGYSGSLKNVQTIKVNINNKTYQGFDGVLFDKDKKRLIRVPPAYGQPVFSVPTGIIEICWRSFDDCNSLTDINIPSSVELIDCCLDGESLQRINVADENSHYSCADGVLFNKEKTMLLRVPKSFKCKHYTIPESVTEISRNAFTGCNNIESLNITENVQTIAHFFRDNTNLKEINVDDKNATYSSLDGVLFNKNRSKLIRFPSAHKILHYSIPDGVIEIEKFAFRGCNQLTKVVIPKGVRCIEMGTFSGCTLLKSVDLPLGLMEIKGGPFGGGAFFGCLSLTSIIIPEGVKRIGYCIFENCTSLVHIELPKSLEEIETHAFRGCSSLTQLSLPENIIRIGNKEQSSDGDICKCAWRECPNLKEITVDKNNPSFCVEDGVLYTKDKTCIIKVMNPSDKKHFIIPDGVTEIHSCAFMGLESLKTVEIPEGVVKIGKYAFRDCPNLTSIRIPSSVTKIGRAAFGEQCVGIINNCSGIYKLYNQSGITRFIIQDSVKEIGDNTFLGCNGLQYIELPDSITRIGHQSFAYCDKLQEIDIPISVKEIDYLAFQECNMLDCLAIPTNVSKINSSAFKGCTGLSRIVVSKSNQQYCSIDGVLFSKDKTTLLRYPIAKPGNTYAIPVGVKVIDELAFEGCVNLQSVTIPEGVVEIRREAFLGCINLESIMIPESTQVLGPLFVSNCKKIAYIKIPKGVQKLDYAFSSNSISRIEVDKSNPYYCSEKGVLFNKDKTRLIRYPQSHKDSTYTIPFSVKEIGDSAFLGCTKLVEIDIHDNVTYLDGSSFMKCHNLKKLIIPKGVTVINGQLFYGCENLEEVKMHKSITHIRNSAFNQCKCLKVIELPASITNITYTSFIGCTGLTEIHSRLEKIDFIDERTFKDIDKKKCVLFVPIGTKYTYKHHPAFKEFKNIITEE